MSAWLCNANAQALPRVELRIVASDSERAERIASRSREFVNALGVECTVRIEVQAEGDSAWIPAAQAARIADTERPMARVAIDATHAEHAQLHIESADGAAVTHDVVLEHGELDEAACEELATLLRSSVEALLEGEPLSQASVSPVSPAPPAPTVTEREAAVPLATRLSASAPASVPVASDTASVTPPPTPPSGARGALYALAGYEVSAWGEGHVLHGPRLASGYGWPLAWGRIGFGFEAFVAVPGSVESQGIQAELWEAAVRAMFNVELALARGFSIDAATGVGARYTRMSDVATESSAEARVQSTRWGMAVRVYTGARLRFGARDRGVAALGLGLEFDPAQVQYGVQYVNGFMATHEPLRVRPSLVASAGMTF